MLRPEIEGVHNIKNALIVTFNKFPDYDAGALREFMFAKILVMLGYNVEVISLGPFTRYECINIENGISHMSLRSSSNSILSKFLSYLLFPMRLYKILKNKEYSLCIYSQVDRISQLCIKNYCKNKKIPCIYDSVEWYSPDQFVLGKFSFHYQLNNKYNLSYIDRSDKVIAISKYLDSYYKSKMIQSVRVPAILDLSQIPYKKSTDREITSILYAGSPGKKDNLAIIIQSIDSLPIDYKNKLRFMIAGCTKHDLIKNEPQLKSVLLKHDSNVIFFGKVTRNQVIDLYQKADYSIIIRSDVKRYAKAGFPTKFVESYATGTPVIANLTSDLGDYLIDEESGFIVEKLDVVSVRNTLLRSMKANEFHKAKMCINSRNIAEKSFDIHQYITHLQSLIKSD